ncbi:phosphotransferase [Streptomyces uncialis]|uniref:phosphotransferase n=1 Tax=Streptomyces uncialis TaxID=1048205 RepID=UPI00364695D6
MPERVEWEDLPAEFRDAVEARTGPVFASESVASGFNCSTALVVHTRYGGCLFLKGVRTSDEAGTAALRCEDRMNRVVARLGPAVRHRFELAGWRALAFTHIDGRHADYGPGTGDLEALARTVRDMRHLRTPTFPVPQLADRFAGHLRPGEAALLNGRHLLHTDLNPHNVLITDPDEPARLVDWAMPALGPAWVDAAYVATWLMCFDQTLEAVGKWLSGIPSWRDADRAAVRAFVDVTCREFTASAGEKDSAANNARFRQLLAFPHG